MAAHRERSDCQLTRLGRHSVERLVELSRYRGG
jgi:hypothetical protein